METRRRVKPHGGKLVSKDSSVLMRLIALFVPRFMSFWTTWRMPWQSRARIGYPPGTHKPESRTDILSHELVHVAQFEPWWGPFVIFALVTVFPLPMYFSGRWFVERRAYLKDIQLGRHSPESAAWILWARYGKPWPRLWMVRWFREHEKEMGRIW